MFRFSLLIIFFIGIPSIVFADVRITEIAWMGTTESQFSEWVELYNDTDQDIDLSGWKLYEAGGDTAVFTFSKTIPTKGYLLLERTTASAPDPVPGINDESGTFGGSGLSNSGEFLVLKDASGTVKQSLDFSGGWPAGESDTKKTMQWDGSSWVSATATPKAGVTKTEQNTNTQTQASTSGGSSTSYVPPKVEPRIDLTVSKTIYTDVSYEYDARTYLESGEVYNGYFVWNMGDGTVYKNITPKVVRHTYTYPGTYTISFGFYKTSYDKKPFLSETIQKNVTTPTITLGVDATKGFIFTNNESTPFDVSDWVIKLPDTNISLPSMTIIAPKTTVVIPFANLGLTTPYTSAVLMTPEWKEVSRLPEKETVTPVVKVKQTQVTNKNSFVASAQEAVFGDEAQAATESIAQSPEKQKSYTKAIFLGIALLIVIGLFLLLERFMAQQE